MDIHTCYNCGKSWSSLVTLPETTEATDPVHHIKLRLTSRPWLRQWWWCWVHEKWQRRWKRPKRIFRLVMVKPIPVQPIGSHTRSKYSRVDKRNVNPPMACYD